MSLITKEAHLEFKAGKQPGEFSGYGAVFGNVDDGQDVIKSGAFRKLRTKANGKIRIPLYHDMSKVVGEGDVIQDEKGLRINGQLNMSLSYAQDAYELMKDGTLDAMSVGFTIMNNGADYDQKADIRTINKAELWEVSIVPFGMNRKAKIRTVKSANDIHSIREFEAFLRETGFSQRDAKAIASKGYGVRQRDVEGTTNETLANLKSMIANSNRY